jgi:hypothetical protein
MILAACAPATQTTAPPTASPAPNDGGPSGASTFIDDLRAAGATVTLVDEVNQPFFSVPGQVIRIDGTDVQVFEYEDWDARQAESDTISADGATIGATAVTWADRPNFWAAGRLIVLYVGKDARLVDLVTSLLGEPMTELPAPPYAAVAAREQLAQSLGIPATEIQIDYTQRQNWPDACLGLPREDEVCAQVLTPGWRVILNAEGREFEFRTDQEGDTIRKVGPDQGAAAGEPTVLAEGRFVGVAGHQAEGTAQVVQLPDGGHALRFEGFSVTAGPDLYVYLVSTAEPEKPEDLTDYVDLGLLSSHTGDQEYVIPDTVDPSQYRSAVVYCLAYTILFARAALAY